ncbi:MAG TPA: hypothetical protein VF131_04165 [Blastocatellia bacterium]|nr:hypothetical protein [Blastocatellia bacterium]
MDKPKKASNTKEPTKAELQRRMEEARESISATVAEIKETVEDQYESVKETIGGVAEWRDQFQKEPLVWSLGALAAGFALGYTLGYAHKNTASSGRKQSEIAAFADSLVDELSAVSNSLIMPTLNDRIRQLFGFDFSNVLEEIKSAKKSGPPKRGRKKAGAKSPAPRKRAAARKSRSKKG